jgi:hypothetical protein
VPISCYHVSLFLSDHLPYSPLLKAWSRLLVKFQVLSATATLEMLLSFRPGWTSCILLLLTTVTAFAAPVPQPDHDEIGLLVKREPGGHGGGSHAAHSAAPAGSGHGHGSGDHGAGGGGGYDPHGPPLKLSFNIFGHKLKVGAITPC